MRPASTFLIMQLSNSRAPAMTRSASIATAIVRFIISPLLYCLTFVILFILQMQELFVNTFLSCRGIIPSLTVEKKNECHNP